MTAPDDVILDRIPEGVDPRKSIGLGVKVLVLLRMLGLRQGDVQWDHRPPLWSRKWNVTANDTVPPANDPEFIVALSVKDHDTITNGIGGERRITSAGSDTHARAKAERLSAAERDFRSNLLRRDAGEPQPERKGAFGSRPFRKPSPQNRATGYRRPTA